MTAPTLPFEIKDWAMFLFGCALSAAGLVGTLQTSQSGYFLASLGGLALTLASFGPTDETMAERVCDEHLAEAKHVVDAEIARRAKHTI